MTGEAEAEGARQRDPARSADRVVRTAALMVIGTLAILALTIGARFLVPVAEALLVWFILKRLAGAIRRIPLVGPRLSSGAASVLAAGLVLLIGLLGAYSGVRGVMNAGPSAVNLQSSLDPLVRQVAALMGTDTAEVFDRMLDLVGVETLMQQIVLGLIGLVNQFGVVAIYVAFLLADEPYFPAKLRAIFPDPARRTRAEALISEIGQQIGTYLWIMTKVSALTAGLSALVMLAFGLHYLPFWTILVFMLNFIPTIGSILGALLPTAFAIVQFGDLQTAALLGIALGLVQFSIGNILLPRMAGQSLNLSLFVTILSLFVWGAIWGITGMFLAVPLTAILVIVLGRFTLTRPIAILLSKTGIVGSGPPAGAAAGP